MKEELATPQQIKKLYVVIRNRGLNPTEYVRKLKDEKGTLTKSGVSKIIDQFEDLDRKRDVVETFEVNQNSKAENEVVETLDVDKDRLSKIDDLLSECIVRARHIVSKELAGTEPAQAAMILELAKFYMEEARRGGAKRR